MYIIRKKTNKQTKKKTNKKKTKNITKQNKKKTKKQQYRKKIPEAQRESQIILHWPCVFCFIPSWKLCHLLFIDRLIPVLPHHPFSKSTLKIQCFTAT